MMPNTGKRTDLGPMTPLIIDLMRTRA